MHACDPAAGARYLTAITGGRRGPDRPAAVSTDKLSLNPVAAIGQAEVSRNY
jgi:hypothetical protein